MEVCPKCGNAIKEDDKFCSNCGTDLKVTAEQVPVKKYRHSTKAMIISVVILLVVALISCGLGTAISSVVMGRLGWSAGETVRPGGCPLRPSGSGCKDCPINGQPQPQPLPQPDSPGQGRLPGGAQYYQNQEMWLIIAEASSTQGQAEGSYNRISKAIGNTEVVLFTDASSHYDGLEPGYWIVFAAADSEEVANKAVATMGDYAVEASVTKVTKTCADAIEMTRIP